MFDIDSSDLSNKITKVFLNIVSIFFSAIVILILLLGIYDFLQIQTNDDGKKCEMTYMYQFPHFVKIPLNNKYDELYPKYGLHIYAEGGIVQDARKQHFTGIPILFLPGNAGSYKQVRSLASIALYKAFDNKTPFHFDFFTIDFNEEISGLYGYVLNHQLEYSRAALERIKSLYENFHQVVIIGHSMGGMIAKSINDKNIQVHLIFTLATPHLHPVAILDPELDIFYHNIQKNLLKHNENDDDDVNVTVVSVAGGVADKLVADKLTFLTTNSFQTSTPAVPGVWVSADHLCILWCKQFVVTVVRILFDLVEYGDGRKNYKDNDNEYFKITTDKNKIDSILSYHLYKRSSGKSFKSSHPSESIMLPPKALWKEVLGQKFCAEGADQRTYIMFPLLTIKEKVRNSQQEDYEILVLTTHTKPKNWLFGCSNQNTFNNVRYCSEFENLSLLGEIIPNQQKAVHLKYNNIKKYSHLVVKILPTQFQFCVHLEVYEQNKASTYLNRQFSTDHRIFFNFSLDTLQNRFLTWKVEAGRTVDADTSIKNHTSVGLFRHENFQTHSIFKLDNDSLPIRFSKWSSSSSHLLLYFDPQYNFNVTIKVALLESAGQIFRTIVYILPSYFASVVILSMFFQRSHEQWSNFHLVLLENAFNLTIIPGLLIGIMLTFVPSDYLKIMDKAEVSIFLPVFCYIAAFGMVFLITAAGWYFLVCSGNALHAIVIKFITKKVGKLPDKVTDFALDLTFAKFPVVFSVLLVSVSAATCGGFGICVGLFFYLIKIFKMYEDLLYDLLKGKINTVKEGLSPINFHQTVATLWFIVTILNLPSLIHWTKNVGYGDPPQWDLAMYICLMLTPAVAILWQDFVPKFNPTLWTVQRYMSYVTGLMIVLWGTHRLYIISFFIVMHLITLAFSQLFSTLLDMASKNEERRIPNNSTSSQDTTIPTTTTPASSEDSSNPTDPQDDEHNGESDTNGNGNINNVDSGTEVKETNEPTPTAPNESNASIT